MAFSSVSLTPRCASPRAVSCVRADNLLRKSYSPLCKHHNSHYIHVWWQSAAKGHRAVTDLSVARVWDRLYMHSLQPRQLGNGTEVPLHLQSHVVATVYTELILTV